MRSLHLSISARLIIIYFIIILLFTFISFNTIIHINRSVKSTKAIYDHPYAVSNAVRDIEKSTISMHRFMKDLVLTDDPAELKKIIGKVELLEQDVISKFNLVYTRYLGSRQDIENAYQSFLEWKNIRNEVIELMNSGKQKQASDMIRGKVAEHVDVIISKLKILRDFADQKIIEFQNNVLNQQKTITRNFVIFLIAIIIFSGLGAFLIIRSISLPINKLIHRITELDIFNPNKFSGKPRKDQVIVLNQFVDQLITTNKDLARETAERHNLQKELERNKLSLEKLIDRKTEELDSANILLSKAIDEAFIGIVSVSLNGDFLKANKKFSEMIGYNLEELSQMTFNDITVPEDRSIGSKAVQDMLAGILDKSDFSKRYIHKNGKIIHARLFTALIRDDKFEPLYFFTQVQDISQQKAAELELKNQQLEQENIIQDKTSRYMDSQKAMSYLLEDVNQIRSELEKSNQKLNDLNKELESFTYSVSHDLRAPLRAIEGFAQILQEDNWQQLNDEGKESIEIIVKNTSMMNQLINDLLDFSRLERKKVRKIRCDNNVMVKNITEDLTAGLQKEKITVVIDDLPICYADPVLIKQVWINLIGNALKYSSTRDHIVINISGKATQEGISFQVKDNGVGFNMKYKDKLFGVFQRLHSSEQFEGNGVGLAIVHKIISKHDGKIWAESESDNGAVFHFLLPLNG